MKNALLLFAPNSPGDHVAGIIMSVPMIGIGIFFLYGASRGRAIPFKSVLPRERVLWTRIFATILLVFGAVVFAFTIYRLVC